MSAGVVTVWRVALDATRPPAAAAVAELSVDERARAGRFATDVLRNRWLHGHVALRRILAKELGVEPRAIEYGRGDHGKPFVARPAGTRIEFSYSDAEDLALVAVSRDGAVGVDVERVREGTDSLRVAESRFAPRERDAIREAGARATDRFYRIWARKEALLKATGAGLSFGLSNVEVPTDERLDTGVDLAPPGAGARWTLVDVAIDDGFHAAIARPVRTTLRLP